MDLDQIYLDQILIFLDKYSKRKESEEKLEAAKLELVTSYLRVIAEALGVKFKSSSSQKKKLHIDDITPEQLKAMGIPVIGRKKED